MYRVCLRNYLLKDHTCQPEPRTRKLIEWEHTLLFGNRQIQERWAIISICWRVHRGPLLNKEINIWIALNRATDDELKAISKARDFLKYRDYLNKKYERNEQQPNNSRIH